jgi:hypothetical protein
MEQKLWCLFTSAGDKNAIGLWLAGDGRRRWDLVSAYYGEDDQRFSEIERASAYSFRVKGGKFQNLKKLVAQSPRFFEPYSYVWVCDDDIRMSPAEIDEAFAITQAQDFWVAQPSFAASGKNAHAITISRSPECDYRIVNFVEVSVPIFRCDKLMEFLDVYDGSLTGRGIDYWYANALRANDSWKFAIIDKVQVTNPHDAEKGGREIDRLQPFEERRAAWHELRTRLGLVEYPPRVFASCRLATGILGRHGRGVPD